PKHSHDGLEGSGGILGRDDNLLINQDFSVWQEAESFTNPASGVYTADGYYVNKTDGGGTAPSVNVKKNVVTMETGFEQCCELEITNVGATGATRQWRHRQTIEDYKKYAGKLVTFSIRLKASTAITFPGRIFVNDGTGLNELVITSLGTDYATYSVTRTIGAAATSLTTSFSIVDDAGTISTLGSIYIQWMKLELGSVATSLTPRSDTVEFLLGDLHINQYPTAGLNTAKIDFLLERLKGNLNTEMAGVYGDHPYAYLGVSDEMTEERNPNLGLGGASSAPVCAIAALMKNNNCALDAVGLWGCSVAMTDNDRIWGGNLIARSDAGLTTPMLCGLEIDMEPIAGVTVSTDSVGLMIVAFNEDMPAPGISITQMAGGTFNDGIRIGGILSTGNGISIAGGSTMGAALNTTQGTFGTAAIWLGNNQYIVFRNNADNADIAAINVDANDDIHVGSSGRYIRLGTACSEDNPVVLRVGGADSQEVTAGANDSGGAGYRLLRVPN
ncbi:MAG: hypothetical protein KAS32_01035, partial [Candidatus Peribacteraceae bacterium]|nr:hypothetical protein [Candidatus Peribacteraceae bacterium]